jgi:CHAT domain-containing protein
MWCLNGSLRGLPIGALWDGRQYTFQRFSSTYFSPAFVPQLARSPSRNVGAIVAGVTGASVVKDPQMGLDVSCPALPAVRRETDEVAAALATKAILDRDFTIKNLLADLSGHPGVIHLASHFCYTPGDDARSFLLTGGNQAWTVEAIKALPEDALQGVDLVTLSACATNEGDSATGSEVESFAAWMQRKGRRGRSIHAVVSERREYCDPNG